MIGGALAHYQIDAKIGEGGMGVVYRATDTHLDRFVAIKVLRADAVSNPERRRRFVQEAKAASALNHPNIVTIHDINSCDGVDYIVMEYVQGRSLDHVIETNRLDTKDVLRYAIAMAGALAKAHEIGLVHRDLKPANIMVTGDGLVKIVDFGLAKLIEPEDSDPGSTTVTMRAGELGQTAPGAIVGTWAYMSPEQAEGKKIDGRSDIFSFGAVLYEMITGRKAFQRETRVATLLAIVGEQPPPLTEGTEGVSRELARIVSRCLQKEQAQRMQHMGDVKIALEQVLSDSEAARLAGSAVDSHSARRRYTGAVMTAGVLLVAAAAATWWLRATRQPGSAPVLTRLTTDSGLTAYPALSPDGNLLAYASDRGSSGGNLDIWIQQMGGGNPIRLTTNDADDLEPNFSPDGSRIVFRSEREGGGVYGMPALGGIEQRLADLGRDPRFSPDGKWVAYWIGDLSYYGRRRIFVMPAGGGEGRELRPEFFFATHPVWSPDSRHLLFRGAPDANATQAGKFDWWITPISGGPAVKTGAADALQNSDVPALERSQLHGGFGVDPGEWLADSVFFSAASGNAGPNAALWRVPISTSRQVKGPAQRLTSGTANELQPAVAGSRIAFASLTENENLWSLDVDANAGKASAEPRRLTSSAASDILPAPSADGAKVAFASNRGGNLHVWVKDLKSGAEQAITSTAGNELPWLMSPDGSRVLYCVFGSAAAEKGCFLIGAAGGVARQVCADCPISNIFDWYAGGRQVLYKKGVSADTSLILRDVDSERETTIFHNPKYNLAAARFSPDDGWISFQTVTGPTRRQIFVAPIRNHAVAGDPEWVPITDGSGLDRNAVWSPDGNLLYFLSERDGFRCFWAQRLDRISKRPIGLPFAVHHFHEARRSLMPTEEVARIGLSVTRDKIIFSMVETSGNIWLARFN